MRVRCRAVADPRSNALGSLALESTPEGLWIAYQSIRSYRDGYAPGPPAVAADHRVPWSAVRATRVGAEHLRLEVQEPLSPFAHFYLRDFARAEPIAWIARARPWAQLSSSQVVLTEFCHELSLRLGANVESEMTVPGELQVDADVLLRRIPRGAVALAIVALAGALAALLLGKATRFAAPPAPLAQETPREVLANLPAPPPRPTEPPPAPVAAVSAPPEPVPLPAPSLGGGCECVRHESLLWERPPPRLTALVSEVRREPHSSHQHLELTLSVVNNGDRELGDLSLGVRIRGPVVGPPGSDDAPVERVLYVPALGPGRQLRWKAHGRGDRYELRIPDLGRLDEDGIDAAPADELLALAASSQSAVSLHAGLMLAFLGDARARETLLGLREGRPASELGLIERALEATGDLRVCQLQASPRGSATRIQSCLYNAAESQQADFELVVRAFLREPAAPEPLASSPLPFAEEQIAWSGVLAPRRGRRLELTLDLSRGTPSAEPRVELVARRKEQNE